MPKKRTPDKRGKPPMSSRTSLVSRRPHSVKDLLARRVPGLTRITDQAARQSFWSEWLSTRLPAELYPRISGVSERDGTLVVFAETAAWSARLRFAVLELEAAIRAAQPEITGIRVRVLPRR
jgi:hypothetical protein